ncbi:MAG TPA: MFS transporter, partial [Streptosporangiaceae bacterium]
AVPLLTVPLLTAPLLTLSLGQAPPSAFMTGLLHQPRRRSAAPGQPHIPRGAAPGQPPIPRTGFSRLVAAATISGLGDGMTQVAGALLALTLTRSPLLVAGLLAAQQLPWVLGALPAGALVDRVDRRRAMAAACLVRAAALGTLGLLAVAGRAGLPVLYLVFLLVGGAGVVYENATTALLPALADRARLTRANGWLQATSSLTRSLLAQPLGAWLFTVAAPVPFLLDTAGLLATAFLTATLPARSRIPDAAGTMAATGASPGPACPDPSRQVRRATWRASMREGLAWLAGHRPLRALALTVAVSNLGLGALFSVFVLFARIRLGTGPLGYGMLLAVMAAGGLAGGLAAGRVTPAIGAATALRADLVVEAFTYAGLLLTHDPVIAAALLAFLAANLAVFSSVSATLRQSLAPPGMLGRVQGAYRAVSNGGLLTGAALGGLLTSAVGLTAPLWLGLAAITTAIALTWRPLAILREPGPCPRAGIPPGRAP